MTTPSPYWYGCMAPTVFDRTLSTDGWTFTDGRWLKREYYRLQLSPQQREIQRWVETSRRGTDAVGQDTECSVTAWDSE